MRLVHLESFSKTCLESQWAMRWGLGMGSGVGSYTEDGPSLYEPFLRFCNLVFTWYLPLVTKANCFCNGK